MSTRESIKSAARALFAAQGYSGTSVAEIAKAVQIKTPSLYAHYASKEEIFMTLVEEVLGHYRDYMKRALSRSAAFPREERLYAYFEDFVRYFRSDGTHAEFMKMLLLFPPAGLADAVRGKIAEVERELVPQLVEAFALDTSPELSQFEAEDLVAAYFSFISGYVVGIVQLSPTLDRDRLRSVWDVFWQGFQSKLPK